MKTPIKVILLVFCVVAAIGGVLVFEKTRVAPPSNLKFEDQFSKNLKCSFESFDSITDFKQSRAEYIRMNDKLNRFLEENVIEASTSDEYRKMMNSTFGNRLTTYGFNMLQKSVWPYDKLEELSSMLGALKSDRLTNGEIAVNDEFVTSSNKINKILGDYRVALALSKSIGFSGLSDTKIKISRARTYRSDEYLKNNAELVNGLTALPGRLAQSHYNHVNAMVVSLSGYRSVSKDYYVNTIIPRVDNAIEEYKKTDIYGNSKPSVSNLESRAVDFVTTAMNYYDE